MTVDKIYEITGLSRTCFSCYVNREKNGKRYMVIFTDLMSHDGAVFYMQYDKCYSMTTFGKPTFASVNCLIGAVKKIEESSQEKKEIYKMYKEINY